MKYFPWVVLLAIALAYPFHDSLPLLEPRTIQGLWGIPFAPLVHTSLTHLLVNLIPLAFLLWVLRREPWGFMLGAFFAIIVWGGVSVWLGGRDGFHEGASGLVLGLVGVLAGRLAWKEMLAVSAIVAAGLLIDYFAALTVSWETHLYGFITGLCYSVIVRTRLKG